VKPCDEGTTRRCGACGSGQMTCTDGEWTDCPGEDPTLMKPETCNGQDDDCTTIIDDINNSITPEITHCACTYQPAASIPDILLRAEACNGIDDNCDGSIDDNAGCCIPEGKTQECGADIGICKNRVKTCTGQKWGPCEWELGPEPAEICGNTLDDNCDGSIDEDCETCTDDDRDGYGYPGSNLCSYPEQDCDDADINVNPGVSEVCNSLDDDCNGQADEYLDCGHCTNNAQDADEEGADCGGAECPACFVWGWLWLTVGGIVILIILAVVWMHMKKQGRELTWETLKEKWSQPE